MLVFFFLEQEQHRLHLAWQRPVTIGKARREVQRRHRHHVLHEPFLSGVQLASLFALCAA
jgi:hypothetical protein